MQKIELQTGPRIIVSREALDYLLAGARGNLSEAKREEIGFSYVDQNTLKNLRITTVDLSGIDCSDIAFKNVRFQHCTRNQKDKKPPNFSQAIFKQCGLVATDLSYANFTNSEFHDTAIGHNNTTKADFSHAVFHNEVYFVGNKLQEAIFQGSEATHQCIFENNDLKHANFVNAKMGNAISVLNANIPATAIFAPPNKTKYPYSQCTQADLLNCNEEFFKNFKESTNTFLLPQNDDAQYKFKVKENRYGDKTIIFLGRHDRNRYPWEYAGWKLQIALNSLQAARQIMPLLTHQETGMSYFKFIVSNPQGRFVNIYIRRNKETGELDFSVQEYLALISRIESKIKDAKFSLDNPSELGYHFKNFICVTLRKDLDQYKLYVGHEEAKSGLYDNPVNPDGIEDNPFENEIAQPGSEEEDAIQVDRTKYHQEILAHHEIKYYETLLHTSFVSEGVLQQPDAPLLSQEVLQTLNAHVQSMYGLCEQYLLKRIESQAGLSPENEKKVKNVAAQCHAFFQTMNVYFSTIAGYYVATEEKNKTAFATQQAHQKKMYQAAAELGRLLEDLQESGKPSLEQCYFPQIKRELEYFARCPWVIDDLIMMNNRRIILFDEQRRQNLIDDINAKLENTYRQMDDYLLGMMEVLEDHEDMEKKIQLINLHLSDLVYWCNEFQAAVQDKDLVLQAEADKELKETVQELIELETGLQKEYKNEVEQAYLPPLKKHLTKVFQDVNYLSRRRRDDAKRSCALAAKWSGGSAREMEGEIGQAQETVGGLGLFNSGSDSYDK